MGSIYLASIVVFFHVLSIGQSPVVQDGVRILAPSEFKSKVDENPSAVLLDVRTP